MILQVKTKTEIFWPMCGTKLTPHIVKIESPLSGTQWWPHYALLMLLFSGDTEAANGGQSLKNTRSWLWDGGGSFSRTINLRI